jgi:hypothetical protein
MCGEGERMILLRGIIAKCDGEEAHGLPRAVSARARAAHAPASISLRRSRAFEASACAGRRGDVERKRGASK